MLSPTNDDSGMARCNRNPALKMSNGNSALVLILLASCSGADLATEFAETSDGGSASLPCNLEPVQAPDRVILVLWHRGDDENPLYKYDARNEHAQHWVDPALRDRYFLRLLDNERAMLTISPSRLEDEAVYHCRVDFYRTPSRITHVNLTVVGEFRKWRSMRLFGICGKVSRWFKLKWERLIKG